MMLRVFSVAVVAVLFMSSGQAFAADVDVADLVEDGPSFANAEITVRGELVGDFGFRGDGTMWTQLNGDSYADDPVVEGGALTGSNIAIAVRMPGELGSGLGEPGRYRTVGPIVELTGVWKYHDPGRQGESYLDVTGLVIVTPDRPLSEPPLWWAFAVGVALLVLAALVWSRYTRKRDAVV